MQTPARTTTVGGSSGGNGQWTVTAAEGESGHGLDATATTSSAGGMVEQWIPTGMSREEFDTLLLALNTLLVGLALYYSVEG